MGAPPGGPELEREAHLRRVEIEHARLAEAFQQSPAFVAVLRGPEHVFEFANARYYSLVGDRKLIGLTVREALPEVSSQGFFGLLDRVYATGEPFIGTDTRVLVRRPPSGTLETLYLDFVYQPLRNAQGVIDGILAHGVDVTSKSLAEARDRFLLALDQAVRGLADPGEITSTAVRLLAEHLDADRAVYADVGPDGDGFDRIGSYSRGGEPLGLRSRFADYGPEMAAALAANRPFVLDDLESADPPLAAAEAYRAGGVRALVAVPVLKNGALVGVLAVRQGSPRAWTPDEVDLVLTVANRCWESIERARAERTLRESEGRFRQLADAMPQIVFAAQPNGTVDYFNKQWYAYTGLPEGSVGYESWRLVHNEEGLRRVMEVWPEALRTGQPYEIEYQLRRHDGAYRWHLGRALPIRDGQGRIVRWYGTNTDIHALKEAEAGRARVDAALAAEKKVLEMIATGSPLPAVLETIARGAEEQSLDGMLCSILVLDESGSRLQHGAAPSLPAAYNQAIHNLPIGPSVGSCGTAAFQRRPVFVTDIASDPLWEGFHDLAEAHGLRACCSTPVISSDGVVLGTVAMYYRSARHPSAQDDLLIRSATHLTGIVLEKELIDRRLRQSLEAEQAARTEAERASRLKEEFLATLSHELRTPLNAVLGWTRILRLKRDLPADVAQGVEVIERNANAQAAIIQDLLDMSAIVSGKVRLNMQPLELGALALAAVDTALPAAQAKQIRIEAAVEAPEDCLVNGDANRLQQVLWNLLSNAVKFTPKEGRVDVRVRRDGSNVEVSVADSGAGIAPEFLPHVFDRFRQADASTTRRHGGLGLGLSIVKQLVELHGGSVRADSAGPGRGATFVVSLPVAVVRDLDGAAPDEHGDVAGLRVLLVDDDADSREMVQRLLEEGRATVITAAGAEEAMQQIAQGRFDVLISDIGMPGQDGHAFIRRVRALGPAKGGDTPALALTAYARPEDRRQAMQSGYQGHAAKPIEPSALLGLVAALARRG